MSDDGVVITAVFPHVPLFTEPPAGILRLIERIETNAARTALHYLATVLAEQVPVDTGELAQSFGHDPATTEGGIELTGATMAEEGALGRIFSTLPQAAVMDEGRRPGSPVSRAGIEALTHWAERKLGVSGPEARSAAFAIAAAITARGLPATHYADRALEIAGSQLETIFANAGDGIAEALTSAGAVAA